MFCEWKDYMKISKRKKYLKKEALKMREKHLKKKGFKALF